MDNSRHTYQAQGQKKTSLMKHHPLHRMQCAPEHIPPWEVSPGNVVYHIPPWEVAQVVQSLTEKCF